MFMFSWDNNFPILFLTPSTRLLMGRNYTVSIVFSVITYFTQLIIIVLSFWLTILWSNHLLPSHTPAHLNTGFCLVML